MCSLKHQVAFFLKWIAQIEFWSSPHHENRENYRENRGNREYGGNREYRENRENREYQENRENSENREKMLGNGGFLEFLNFLQIGWGDDHGCTNHTQMTAVLQQY